MIRVVLLAFVAVVAACSALSGGSARAETAATWIKIASVEIDPRVTGKKNIDLGGAGRFKSLRCVADRGVGLSWAIVPGASKATLTVVVAGNQAELVRNDIVSSVDTVEVAWKADSLANGPVKLTIWGQLRDDAAKEATAAKRKMADEQLSKRDEAEKSTQGARERSVGAAKRAIESAEPASPPVATAPPPPAQPAPATRGITDAGPSPLPAPPGGSRPPVPVPPVVDIAAPPKPNVCVDQSVCTIVDVFYGTDRAAVPGPDRLSFGGDRANKLTLGHAFVTVPKSQRAKGAIPLPGIWDKYVLGVPAEGDPARHFTIPKNGVVVYSTEAEFLTAAKKHIATAGDFKNHAFIFVHGFYVSFDNALYRTAQIAYDLSPDGRPFGTAFLYSWPSAGNASAYIYDQDSAQFSVPHLQAFLRTVIDKTGVENVHIIAHSMGNVALIGALQEMARNETKAKVNQIILAAPDVDKQQFELVAKSVERVAKGMTLYASQGDNALALARKVRGGTPRAGESLMPPGPAVVAGIDTIDVSAIPTSVFSWGHDSYADSSELLADIAALFTKGDHPPNKRSAKFQLLQQGTLQYWKYAK